MAGRHFSEFAYSLDAHYCGIAYFLRLTFLVPRAGELNRRKYCRKKYSRKNKDYDRSLQSHSGWHD